MFRFMPIEQTNSLVVITPQPEYLKSAEEWLYRLDRGGAENATQLYVYNVKNLKAPDLADYLSQIFLGTSTGSSHRKHDRQRRAGPASDDARRSRRQRQQLAEQQRSRIRR